MITATKQKSTPVKNPTPKIEFNEENHEYFIQKNGQKIQVPGTTTITGVIDKSAPLMWWAVNCARDYILDHLEPGEPLDELEIEQLAKNARLAHRNASDKAKNLGTLVHEWIEAYIKAQLNGGPEPEWPVNEAAHEPIIEFLDWEERSEVVWGSSEVLVYNNDAKYAGTFDALAKVNGQITIIDFKTASGIYGTHKMQTAAYLKAEENYRRRLIDGFIVLRIPKDATEFETYSCFNRQEIEEHFEGFKGAREVLRWQMRHD